MDRGEDQIILVLERRAGEVPGRLRRVERQLGEKALAAAELPRDLLQHVQVRGPDAGRIVEPLEQGLVPAARLLDLPGPGRGRGREACHHVGEGRPQLARARRRLEVPQGGGGKRGRAQRRHAALRVGRAHARHQLQYPEGRDGVSRVVRPAQHGEQVLDVGSLEKLEAAVLHEGNVPAQELDLERVAVVRASEQHRLALQQQAGLAVLQDPADDVQRLRPVVEDRHQFRLRSARASRPQRLAVLTLSLGDQRVGRVQHLLGGPIVLLQ